VLVLGCALLPRGDASIPRGRLPGHVRPVHYELEITPRFDLDRFLGRVGIRVEITRPVRTIWLHGRNLEVTDATVSTDAGTFPATWEQRTRDGVAALQLEEPVGPGSARIDLRFASDVARDLRGFYRVDVADDAYGFTQFEPISARRAFPCFDEPAFKTPFDLSVVLTDPQLEAVAGMPVAETKSSGGTRTVRFATTPPLPTYLLAWAVGPLDRLQAPPLPATGPRQRAVPFGGVATRGRAPELRYALERTPPLLTDLEAYFGIPYPYPKLDVIAVPDFGAGAMENAGAITFREYLLLIDASTAPERQRRLFSYIMAHELAHQWFGNLVTMAWWDDLWLNEAFATWLGFGSVGRVEPEQGADVILLEQVLAAMAADSLASARSIRQPITSNHDIRNAFDAITYSKGAGVLAMFERWLGPETFRDGIRRYLSAHADGSARTEDLLAALSQASGRDVAAPFQTFLTQPGVPLVEVTTRCAGDGPALSLRQSRYRPVGSHADAGALWQIPVCARYAAGGAVGESCTLLSGREGRLPLQGDACPEWVMPNAEAAGYYRFTQPADDAAKLLDRGRDALSTRERVAVAHSLAAALHADLRGAAQVYSALGPLARDPQRAVAIAPMGLLRTGIEQLADEDTRGAAAGFARRLYRPQFERLGWDSAPGESGDERLLRQEVIQFLTHVAPDPAVRAEAARRGRLYAGIDGAPDEAALEPELVESALAAAVQEGGAPVWEILLAQLLESDDARVRGERLTALGQVDDPELVARAQRLALDPVLRVNESLTTLWYLSERPAARASTWRFVEENWDALVARVGSGRAGQLPGLAAGFCDTARAEQVADFMAPRIQKTEGGPRNLAGALEQIRLCAALVEAQAASARDFFRTVSARR
jgi:alanyl aminopeptidase